MTTLSTDKAGCVVVEALARAGVRRFYTVPGESFLEVLDAVQSRPGLSLISTRHESGAAFMAGADARAALAARAPSLRPARDWTEANRVYLDSSTIPPAREAEGGDPAAVVAAQQEVVPEDTVLANDAGNFSVFVHRYWRYKHPHTQLAPASGAMGYGVPAAVAAKLAAPERTVVALCGDGGFLMTGQEMETAVRYGAQIVAVVFRNGMHGTIAMHQVREIGRTAGTGIGKVWTSPGTSGAWVPLATPCRRPAIWCPRSRRRLRRGGRPSSTSSPTLTLSPRRHASPSSSKVPGRAGEWPAMKGAL